MLLIINSLPGRVRFKSDRLHNNPKLSKYLHAYIDSLFGVKSSTANPYTATILIEFDKSKTSIDALKENVNVALSSPVKDKDPGVDKYEEYNTILEKRDKARTSFIMFSLLYMALKVKLALYGRFALGSNVRVLQMASVVTITGGYPILKKLYRLLTKHLPADFDVLLKFASVSFTIVRESSQGLLLLVLKELNDYLKLSADAENWRLLNQTTGKNTGMAWLTTADTQEILVSAVSLKPGDIICVHKGEVIPANGDVLDGQGMSNSLYYTGQPVIENLSRGGRAYEGVSLISGEIRVKVAETPVSLYKEDISLDKLYLQKRVYNYQKAISKVSLAASSASYLFSYSSLKALSTLLVMTPSGTGTALSSGFNSYITVLSRKRIFLRNQNTFESITKVNHIIFDKTGTLTYGIMQLAGMESFSSRYSESDLLKICASCEANNYHPISISLKAGSHGRYDSSKVGDSVYIPSKGVIADYDGHKVVVGNMLLMEENGIDTNSGKNQYKKYEEQFCTPVFIAIDGRLEGIIALKDRLRDDSAALVKRLKAIGIDRITIVTGDTVEKAGHFASSLGIRDVYGSCSLEDKAGIVKEAKKHGVVMMVGDGINDLPAMVQADISVSFVDSACDKVKLHSDCIILEDNMLRLADLFTLSVSAYRKINQSITVSELFNCTFGVVGSLGNINAFTAKSLNTSNSLLALLLNKRIEFAGR